MKGEDKPPRGSWERERAGHWFRDLYILSPVVTPPIGFQEQTQRTDSILNWYLTMSPKGYFQCHQARSMGDVRDKEGPASTMICDH